MKILIVSSEAVPYVQTGGLGDVIGTLSQHLSQKNHQVTLVLPFYRTIRQNQSVFQLTPMAEPLAVPMGDGTFHCRVWVTQRSKHFHVYFIEFNHFFDRNDIYSENGNAYLDNCQRFAFFTKAALDLALKLQLKLDIVHCHDWQTSLASYYLKSWYWSQPLFRKTASVLTIHNMGYQGNFSIGNGKFIGLNWMQFRSDEFEDHGGINLLKGGIFYADVITTVSPTYAKEILSEPGGCGLSTYLARRSEDIEGILNGIDETEWNSATDPFLPSNFSADDLTGKAVCKETLQLRFGLKPDPTIPIFGLVGRMVYQKGLQMLMECAETVLSWELQLIVLGNGEPIYTNFFDYLARGYRNKVGVYIGFQNKLAHLIEAGSDFFIMPSLYEPCGLNQIYSMLYGSLPIVRATGGLSDTVQNFDEQNLTGTGFVFYDISGNALKNTIGWALHTWFNNKPAYERLQQNAMRQKFGWQKAIQRYESVYRKAVSRKKSWV